MDYSLVNTNERVEFELRYLEMFKKFCAGANSIKQDELLKITLIV